MKTTPEIRAMNAVELAVRRTAGRVKAQHPGEVSQVVGDALEELADEIYRMVEEACLKLNPVEPDSPAPRP